MVVEVEEKYPLENGLPRNQETPQAVNEFYQKHSHYPAKVIVNPKHQVNWSKYSIPVPIPIRPSIKPLGHSDIEDAETFPAQFYCIAIEYDEKVDENTLLCRGFINL